MGRSFYLIKNNNNAVAVERERERENVHVELGERKSFRKNTAVSSVSPGVIQERERDLF